MSEIWKRRSLILALASNDLRLRYKNSVLGFFWSFLEPLLMLTVLYFVFTYIIKNNVENYVLYLFLGIIMWNMFSRGSTMGLNSILYRSGLVSKTYLPREILVISSCLTSFYMMSLEFIIFAIFAIVSGLTISVTIVIFPLMIVSLFIMTLGVSFALSVLYVKYRDLQSIWAVILQAGFWLAPIVYRITIFPDNIRKIVSINPFVPILETSHDTVLYNSWPNIDQISEAVLVPIIIFVIGYLIFRAYDKKVVEEM